MHMLRKVVNGDCGIVSLCQPWASWEALPPEMTTEINFQAVKLSLLIQLTSCSVQVGGEALIHQKTLTNAPAV